MNRPLKFRVWDKNDNKYWLTKDGLYFYLENLQDQRLAVSISKFIKESRFIVQQFTGLLDKNGKEVYEGDVISEHYPALKRYESGEVIYSKEYLTYLSKKWTPNKKEYWSDYLSSFESENIEIIGNIFENPALLDSPDKPKQCQIHTFVTVDKCGCDRFDFLPAIN